MAWANESNQIRENSNSETDAISVSFKTVENCYYNAKPGEISFQLNGGNGGLSNQGKRGFSREPYHQLTYGSRGYGNDDEIFNVDLDKYFAANPGAKSPADLYVLVNGGLPTTDGLNPGDGGGGGGVEVIDYNGFINDIINNTLGEFKIGDIIQEAEKAGEFVDFFLTQI